MAAARLAPVLSATSRMERICNINYQEQRCSFKESDRHRRHSSAGLNNLHQTPAFHFGERPGFFNSDPVTDFGFALLIVCVKLLVAGHDFFVPAMRKAP